MAASFTETTTPSSPVPSYRSTIPSIDPTSALNAQVSAALQGHSRLSVASSVFSSGTKLTTDSAGDDARSVELNLGGTIFRINRDASCITTRSPSVLGGDPYQSVQRTDEVISSSDPLARQGFAGHIDFETTQSVASVAERPCAQDLHESAESNEKARQKTILNLGSDSTPRVPSPVSRNGFVVAPKAHLCRQEEPSDDISIRRKPLIASAQLGHRGTMKPPGESTSSTCKARQSSTPFPQGLGSSSTQPQPTDSSSGYESGGNLSHAPLSTFIDRRNGRSSPSICRKASNIMPGKDNREAVSEADSPADKGSSSCLPMAREARSNETLSESGIIRNMRQNHKEAVFERDQEIESLKRQLDEERVLSKLEADDLRSQVSHLKAAHEVNVERARHDVEHTWKCRWKDRDIQLSEKMRRIELEHQSDIERAIANRDRIWKEAWSKRCGRLLRTVSDVVRASEADLDNGSINPKIG